jgi:hypothetical protein
MNKPTEQAGANPDSHTITVSILRLALAGARMSGRSLDEILGQYVEG